MTAVYALGMASLVILCMSVPANAITEHVFYVSLDGHVRELWFNGRGGWQGNDLTANTNGPSLTITLGRRAFSVTSNTCSTLAQAMAMCMNCTLTAFRGRVGT